MVFLNFYEDMGDKPTDGHILGRKDLNGNYEPSNCKWATRSEQSIIRQDNKILTVNNISKTMKEWSDISGTKYTFSNKKGLGTQRSHIR